jgi:hypothetical protein
LIAWVVVADTGAAVLAKRTESDQLPERMAIEPRDAFSARWPPPYARLRQANDNQGGLAVFHVSQRLVRRLLNAADEFYLA